MLPSSIPQGLERGEIRNLLALEPADFLIAPIARRLAQVNRYAGAIGYPYSVAIHSVVVSHLAPERYAREALLHDITESFGIGDLISPIKRGDDHYNEIERAIRAQLCAPFGLSLEEPAEVRRADERAYQIECRYRRGAWPLPDHTRFVPWYPTDFEHEIAMTYIMPEFDWRAAATIFEARYEELTGQ